MPDDETISMDQLSAHLDRGWDLVARGDIPAALVSAEQSLELDGDAPEAHYLVGYVRQCAGDAEEALEHYRQALELDEGFFEAMLYAADLLIHELSDPAEALSFLDDAEDYAETDDEVADVLLLRREALLALGREDDAERAVKALPTGPYDNAGIAFAVAEVLLERGQHDQAEKQLREAIRRDPQLADAHHLLGVILDERGVHREATVCFLRARDLDLVTPPPRWSMDPARFEERVQAAIGRLPARVQEALDGALVHVGDLPGAEVVADGVDPRAEVLAELVTIDDPLETADDPSATPAVRVGRLFVYQRNVERSAMGLAEIEDLLYRAIHQEVDRVHTHALAEGPAGAASTSPGETPTPDGDSDGGGEGGGGEDDASRARPRTGELSRLGPRG